MNCRFEEVQKDHLQTLLEIYNYYVLNSTSTFHQKELNTEEMTNLLFFNQPQYKAFTIFFNEDIAGYVVLARHKQREAYALTAEIAVYLKAKFKGKGIGKEAVRFIEKFAISKKFHTLIANVCSENIESIKLFAALGYTKCAHFSEVGKKFDRFLDVVSFQKILE